MTKTRKKQKRRKNKSIKNKTRIKISSKFESGNIKLKSIEESSRVILEIKDEPNRKYKRKYQNWFYFKASNALFFH